MTAISVDSTPVAQPTPPGPTQSTSHSAFSALLKDAGPSKEGNSFSFPVPGKLKNTDDGKDRPLAVAVFIPTLPKLILPVVFRSLNDGTPAPESAPTPDVETIDLQPPVQAAKPASNELAFALKLVATAPQPQIATQLPVTTATPTAAAASPAATPHANGPIPRIGAAPVVTEPPDRRVLPAAQPREAAPSQPEAAHPGTSNSPAPHASTESATAPLNPIVEGTVLRGVVSSPITPPSIEPAPQASIIEHIAQPSQQSPATPLNEITVRVANADQSSASIRMVDRSGELRVAVRASDPQLTESLRGNVEQLASKLNSNGLSAEVWKPATTTPAVRTSSSSQDMTNGQQTAKNFAGNYSDRNQQNKKQNYPDWVEEFYANNE